MNIICEKGTKPKIENFCKKDQKALNALYKVYLNERRYIWGLDLINCNFDSSMKNVSPILGEDFSIDEITETDHSKRGIGSRFCLSAAYSDATKRLLERCQSYFENAYDISIPPLANPDRLLKGEQILLCDVINGIAVSLEKVSA